MLVHVHLPVTAAALSENIDDLLAGAAQRQAHAAISIYALCDSRLAQIKDIEQRTRHLQEARAQHDLGPARDRVPLAAGPQHPPRLAAPAAHAAAHAAALHG